MDIMNKKDSKVFAKNINQLLVYVYLRKSITQKFLCIYIYKIYMKECV